MEISYRIPPTPLIDKKRFKPFFTTVKSISSVKNNELEKINFWSKIEKKARGYVPLAFF